MLRWRLPLGRWCFPTSALTNAAPSSSMKYLWSQIFCTCLAPIFGWPSHNTKPMRTLMTRHRLVDVCRVTRHQVIPKANPVVIHPLHSKLLNLGANVVTNVRQNNIQGNKQRLKGLLRKPRYSRRSTGTQLKNKSTGTRKSTSTQLVRSTGTQLRSRSTGTRKSTSTLVVPSRSTSTSVGNNARLGTARPVKSTWRVGVSGNKEIKQ